MDAHQTTIYTAVLIAAVIIGIIIVYFVISMIRQQRYNLALYKSKIQAEINTLEKERARMAADLHDELGPILSSVKIRMNCLDIASEEDQSQLERINTNIDDIMKRMREISNDLMPSVLLRKGLISGIQDAVDRISKPHGLTIYFQFSEIPEPNQDKAIHIYRIVQEILHNTIKHARASRLNIELKQEDSKLVLTSRDNGVGFDHSRTTRESGGMGLRSLLSRAEILNGEMYIHTQPGKGTEYVFEIPI